MGGVADGRIDRSRQGARGDALGAVPGPRVDATAHRAVAGERELAAGAARGALIDDAADGLGEGGVADAVQDHLGHGLHAVAAFAAGFVIDDLGQAIEIAAGVQGVGHAERPGADRRGQIGATQVRSAVVVQLVEAGGQEFRLAVALGGARAGIGIVSACDRERAGVQAPGGGRERFFGEAGGGGAVNPFGLGAQRIRLRQGSAQIGAADRQSHQTAKGRCSRHGLDLRHTIGARRGARLRGMRQRVSPVQQGEKRCPRGSLACWATLTVAFQLRSTHGSCCPASRTGLYSEVCDLNVADSQACG